MTQQTAVIPAAKFKIGDRVMYPAFVNCFGKLVDEARGLTVTDVRLIMPVNHPLDSNPLAPYSGPGWRMIEAAERFFALEGAL